MMRGQSRREIVDVPLAGVPRGPARGARRARSLLGRDAGRRAGRRGRSRLDRPRLARAIEEHGITLELRRLVARQLRACCRASVYAGNRFQSRRAAYPPLLSEPADIGPHVPPIVPDIPRLSAGSGPSALAVDAGDLATPALGVHVPAAHLGIIVLARARRRGGRRSSLAIAESDDRAARHADASAPASARGESPGARPRVRLRRRPRAVRTAVRAPQGADGTDRAGSRAAVLRAVRRPRGARERPLDREARLLSRPAIARHRVHDLADGLVRRAGDDAAADRRGQQDVARARVRDHRVRARRRPGAVGLLPRHLRRQDLVRRRFRAAGAGAPPPPRAARPQPSPTSTRAAGTSSGAPPRR